MTDVSCNGSKAWCRRWLGAGAGVLVVAVALAVASSSADAAMKCAQWGEQCDASGKNCIQVCKKWVEDPPPFEVKKSGETAAPGTVTPGQKEEIERQERKKKELQIN